MRGTERFFEAVEAGDVERVGAMLDVAPGLVAARDAAGRSAVLVAAYRDRQPVAALLLERGAVLDVCEAAALGALDRLDALLARAPDAVHERSADGWTPLHLACFFGQLDAAERLLDAGAQLHALSENEMRNTPLHAALAGSRNRQLIERLLDAGADVDAHGAGGWTPLHLAAARGDLALIDLLLARGAHAVPAADGRLPVDLARERGHREAAAQLARLVGE